MRTVLATVALGCIAQAMAATRMRKSEIKRMPGHTKLEDYTSPLPRDYIPDAALPTTWDWRNVSGVQYTTELLNQHIPTYCGSCWAHGSMSSLADRWKIIAGPTTTAPVPAIQVILNCGTMMAGSCDGGTATGAYQWVKENGVPDITCQQYKATDQSCTAENTCRNCNPQTGCFAVERANYTAWGVKEYGQVSGVQDMKKEIFARGPISCGVDAIPIEDYHGGVITSKADEIDHIVAVVGWEVTEQGEEVWIMRNSWGTYWGEEGWARVKTGINAIGIESDCSWAIPTRS